MEKIDQKVQAAGKDMICAFWWKNGGKAEVLDESGAGGSPPNPPVDGYWEDGTGPQNEGLLQ